MMWTSATRTARVATGASSAPPTAVIGCALHPACPAAMRARVARARAPPRVFRYAGPPAPPPLAAGSGEIDVKRMRKTKEERIDELVWPHDSPQVGTHQHGSAPSVLFEARPRPPVASFAEQVPTKVSQTSTHDDESSPHGINLVGQTHLSFLLLTPNRFLLPFLQDSFLPLFVVMPQQYESTSCHNRIHQAARETHRQKLQVVTGSHAFSIRVYRWNRCLSSYIAVWMHARLVVTSRRGDRRSSFVHGFDVLFTSRQ
jgi:hypothetical protein